MTSAKGNKIIESGWRVAGIMDTIRLWSIPSMDPFHIVDHQLFENDEGNQLQAICDLTLEER